MPKPDEDNIAFFAGIDSYSQKMADFLVKNANQEDFSVNLDNKEQYEKTFSFSKQLLPVKPFDKWNRFGKVFLEAESKFKLANKIQLTGNKASADAALRIRHDIVPSMPPHFSINFHVEASDQEILANKSRNMGKIELTFEGLLLKGVPNYLRDSKVAQREFKKYGIELVNKEDPNKITDKGALKRVLNINTSSLDERTLYAVSNDLRNIETRLDTDKKEVLALRKNFSELKAKIEQAKQGTNPENVEELEKQLINAQNELKKLQANEPTNVVSFILGRVIKNSSSLSEARAKLEREIADFEDKIRQARITYNTAFIPILENNLIGTQDKLQTVQDRMQKDIADKYQKLATIPLSTTFTCGPEFFREIKFPIIERRVSANGAGSSAQAGVGISGDVVIDVSKPTCTAALVPPFKLQSAVYSDVSIKSNGYIGAKADAQSEIAVNFQDSSNARNKYGNFELKSYKVALEDNEKKAMEEFVNKLIDDAKSDQELVNKLAKKIETDVLPALIDPAIENWPSNVSSINIKDACSSFEKQIKGFNNSKLQGSMQTLLQVCRVQKLDKIGKLPKPADVKKWKDDLEAKKGELNNVLASLKKKLLPKQTIKNLCNLRRISRAVNELCNRISPLNSIISELQTRISPFSTAEKFANLEKKYSDYLIQNTYIYGTKAKDEFKKLIKQVAKNYIFRPVKDISKPIANKILKRAWELEETGGKVNEWVDISNEILQMGNLIPERLSIGASASGRIALSSTATFIKTRPEIENTLELKFEDTGKPSLKTNSVAYKNGKQAEEGILGGFNPLGIKLTATHILCVGGKVSGSECSPGTAKKIAPKPIGRDKHEPWYIESTPEAFEKIAPGTKL
ncbi:MAG: hypothetical protein KME38_20665 [Spirirestis rafaelensis WJT71-NPBG6]|nr:hypothetical protein [Spirirestis rafaelensis WJT71-NPBG6]